jgi:tRNA (guanosine-2'-O-)-methyltransferase
MDPKALFCYLAQFVQERRLNLIEKTINSRTRYMSILLEDVYQSKNISAVLRTAECLGIQNIHIVENKNKFEYNPYVTRGADKWLTIKRYNALDDNSKMAIQQLKNEGYRLIVTSPNVHGNTPEAFDINNGKFVVAFGTEWKGASKLLLQEADEFIKIPMVGYTESLNLSVSAAIVMYTLTNRLRNHNKLWQLNEEEKATLKLEWVKTMVKKPELLINNFLNIQK